MLNMKNNQGFSLIELVIAIAILAIMSVGSISAMGYLSMANSSKCASRIDSSLTRLKSKKFSGSQFYFYAPISV